MSILKCLFFLKGYACVTIKISVAVRFVPGSRKGYPYMFIALILDAGKKDKNTSE